VDVDGVFCFLIDKRRDDQWLKTPNAKRFIPIHHELIKLGFLDFIKDLKKKFTDDTRLFHNIPLIQDSYSAKPSEWFIRNFRDSLGQPSHVAWFSAHVQRQTGEFNRFRGANLPVDGPSTQ
jgi:hypothetical protein